MGTSSGGGSSWPLLHSPVLGLHALLSPTPQTLPSPLPGWQAWSACLSMTAIYVFSLYLLPASIRRRPRDDPVHIRARFASVATACLLALRCVLELGLGAWDGIGRASAAPSARLMGAAAGGLCGWV